jgi:hypothetical protein
MYVGYISRRQGANKAELTLALLNFPQVSREVAVHSNAAEWMSNP